MAIRCATIFALVLLLTPGVVAHRLRETSQRGAPPAPVGKAPAVDKDGAYDSKDHACAACKFAATGSCAMYKSCVCYATNAFWSSVNVASETDKDNWHYACG
eukprot:CAMPEP_0170596232 /NCGR_PEP_ID=MMETSP0224-20130122/14998_1 /TAXON_ID=285029 /ORGANISM="Togula jolla, Strain CCCM 725" /LENGTH=101 /DNA_ID=CAMNT_0010920491 /DNA_START=67 /DNA_END=369 /DNA_ORIENTATION=+